MTRTAYLIICLAMLVLGAYVLWPERGPVGAGVALVAGPLPAALTVRGGGLVQEVVPEGVRIQGVLRPLAADHLDVLWTVLTALRAPAAKVVEKVPEERLADYGIDGTRALDAGAFHLRWGVNGDTGYLWEGGTHRLAAFPADVIRSLDQRVGRLDRLTLVPTDALAELAVGALRIVPQGNDWVDAGAPGRPPLTRRVLRLLTLVDRLQLMDFAGPARGADTPLGELRITLKSGTQQTVRVWRGAARLADAVAGAAALVPAAAPGRAQVDDLPVQPLPANQLAQWDAALADLGRDYLFNLARDFSGNPVAELAVTRAGMPVVRLEKHGLRDELKGQSQWDVVWPGGREVADAAAVARIAYALDQLVVQAPRPRTAADVPPADATVLGFRFQSSQRVLSIALAGERIWSATHVATVAAWPDDLRDLGPDRMLDTRLTTRALERVVKLQRLVHDEQPPRAELYAADGTAGWRQVLPVPGAVNQLAVERIARAICTARAQSARLATAADRALLAAPALEVSLRFAPARALRSNDDSRASDTVDQDLGLAFAREGESWRALDSDGGVSFLVDPELVELLRLPVLDNLVLPLVPSLVERIEVQTGRSRYRLARSVAGWTLATLGPDGQPDAAGARPADAVQVRRYLRLLAGLRAARSDAQAGPLLPAELAASIICVLPGRDRDVGAEEQLVLAVGRPAADGSVPLHAEAGRGERGGPQGRAWIPAAEAANLIWPEARFLPAAPTTGTAPPAIPAPSRAVPAAP